MVKSPEAVPCQPCAAAPCVCRSGDKQSGPPNSILGYIVGNIGNIEGGHTLMKMTIDIPEPLLRKARQLAARKRTTLRALVEHCLRQVLEDRYRGRTFRLRDARFKGRGLQLEHRDASWERLRALAYESRGE
jgi:hypothetical protein